jgi:hypothetical protein
MDSKSIQVGLAVVALMLVVGGPAVAQDLFGYSGTNDALYTIDPAIPSATLVGTDSGSGIVAEIEHDGAEIWAADTGDNTNLHRIDPATGAVLGTTTLVFPPDGNVLTSLEFVDTTLYAGLTTEGGGETYLATVDTGTGAVTTIGSTGTGVPFGGLAYNGLAMYGISAGGSQATLYTIDLGTGAATAVGPVLVGGSPIGLTGLEWGTDGVLYAVPNGSDPAAGSILTIDPATAAATNLGNTGELTLNALTALPWVIPVELMSFETE